MIPISGAFVGAPSSLFWDRHAASLIKAAAFASLNLRFCVPKAFCKESTSMVSPDRRNATLRPRSLEGVTFCRWSSVAASAVAAFLEDGTGAVFGRGAVHGFWRDGGLPTETLARLRSLATST